MQKIYKHIVVILFSINLSAVFAQRLDVSAILEPKKILIGQHAKISLTVRYDESIKSTDIIWPVLKDTISKQIEIIDSLKPANQKEQELTTETKIYTITCFDSGYYAIKPFAFYIQNNLYETSALLFEVHTVETDTTQPIKDIKEIFEEEMSFGEYAKLFWDWLIKYWYISLPVFMLACFLIWYFLIRKKKNQPVIEIKPAIPAHIRALQLIEQLEKTKPWQTGDVKIFYVDLTDIIRKYIEEQFDIPALEKTTDEIMQEFRLTDVSDECKMKLRMLLRLADLVKFAKEKPLESENLTAIERAREFVMITTPKQTNE